MKQFSAFKKISRGILMVTISILLLQALGYSQHQEISLSYIRDFDPTNLAYQCETVEFELPVVHNRWIPVSCVRYSADGNVLASEEYYINASGTLTYTAQDGSIYYPQTLVKDLSSLNFLSDTMGEQCYFEAKTTKDETHLCGYVCVTKLGMVDDGQGNVSMAYGYGIISFGQYDYGSYLRVEHPRYIKTSQSGQLKMLVTKTAAGYWSYWFDDFGRKSWIAGYTLEGELYQYVIYKYKEV